jgi:hypothetical protein
MCSFLILFCFQEIIVPKTGTCSPYLLDLEYDAWSIFYMTGLYFRTDESYIILIDFFNFSFPSQIKGGSEIEIAMKYQGNSTQICNYQEIPSQTLFSSSCVLRAEIKNIKACMKSVNW